MGSFITEKQKYIIPYDSLLHKVIDYDKEQNYTGKEGELFFAKKDKDGIETIALFVGTLSGKNIQLTDYRDYSAVDVQKTIKELREYITNNVNAVNEKLNKVEDGAQVNIIEEIGVSEDSKIAITIDGKKVIIDDSVLVKLISALQERANGIDLEIEEIKVAEEEIKNTTIALKEIVNKKADQSSLDELSRATEESLDDKANVEDVENVINSLNNKYVSIEDGKSLVDNSQIKKLQSISNGANKVEASSNGYIKIDGNDTIVYTHPDKHNIIDIENLQNILDAKQNVGSYADKSHSHLKNDISDFDHKHLIDEIIDFEKEVAEIEVEKAKNADEATKAIQDGNGNIIADTYAKKSSTYTKEEVNEEIEDVINTFVGAYIASDGGAINKLQEIADWIDSDKNGAADIVSDIERNTQDISNLNVRIDNAEETITTIDNHSHENKATLDSMTPEMFEKLNNGNISLWKKSVKYKKGDLVIAFNYTNYIEEGFEGTVTENNISDFIKAGIGFNIARCNTDHISVDGPYLDDDDGGQVDSDYWDSIKIRASIAEFAQKAIVQKEDSVEVVNLGKHILGFERLCEMLGESEHILALVTEEWQQGKAYSVGDMVYYRFNDLLHIVLRCCVAHTSVNIEKEAGVVWDVMGKNGIYFAASQLVYYSEGELSLLSGQEIAEALYLIDEYITSLQDYSHNHDNKEFLNTLTREKSIQLYQPNTQYNEGDYIWRPIEMTMEITGAETPPPYKSIQILRCKQSHLNNSEIELEDPTFWELYSSDSAIKAIHSEYAETSSISKISEVSQSAEVDLFGEKQTISFTDLILNTYVTFVLYDVDTNTFNIDTESLRMLLGKGLNISVAVNDLCTLHMRTKLPEGAIFVGECYDEMSERFFSVSLIVTITDSNEINCEYSQTPIITENEIDSVPTKGSNNPISSNAVYEAIGNLETVLDSLNSLNNIIGG